MYKIHNTIHSLTNFLIPECKCNEFVDWQIFVIFMSICQLSLLPQFESERAEISHETPHIDAQATVCQLHLALPNQGPRKTSISQPPNKISKIWLVTFLTLIRGVFMQNFSPLSCKQKGGDLGDGQTDNMRKKIQTILIFLTTPFLLHLDTIQNFVISI